MEAERNEASSTALLIFSRLYRQNVPPIIAVEIKTQFDVTFFFKIYLALDINVK
jgi:hypothetical protein